MQSLPASSATRAPAASSSRTSHRRALPTASASASATGSSASTARPWNLPHRHVASFVRPAPDRSFPCSSSTRTSVPISPTYGYHHALSRASMQRLVGGTPFCRMLAFRRYVRAKVAELVDARDLGSRGLARGGSSPPFRTGLNLIRRDMANQTAELQVSMEKSGAWARRLTITVPAARVDREKKAAVQRYARQVRLPGFRKGKVPVQLMEKRWGPAIEQEAIEKLIGDAYREAIE